MRRAFWRDVSPDDGRIGRKGLRRPDPRRPGRCRAAGQHGIQQGDVVKVVQNQGGSLLIETAAGGRYVLGGGMANKIYVTRE